MCTWNPERWSYGPWISESQQFSTCISHNWNPFGLESSNFTEIDTLKFTIQGVRFSCFWSKQSMSCVLEISVLHFLKKQISRYLNPWTWTSQGWLTQTYDVVWLTVPSKVSLTVFLRWRYTANSNDNLTTPYLNVYLRYRNWTGHLHHQKKKNWIILFFATNTDTDCTYTTWRGSYKCHTSHWLRIFVLAL